MKLLLAFSTAQILLIIVLVVRIGDLEVLSESHGSNADQAVSGKTQDRALTRQVDDATPSSSLNSKALRQIVREELRAFAVSNTANQSEIPESAPVEYDPIEMEYRVELAQLELDMLRTGQDISQHELDRVLAAIVALDPENRAVLLGQLNQAMNRGEIKARF